MLLQLMSKLAPLVGRDLTERCLMPRFAELCTDAHFHVRKVCAANFGDLCAVVGTENTEVYLVSADHEKLESIGDHDEGFNCEK